MDALKPALNLRVLRKRQLVLVHGIKPAKVGNIGNAELAFDKVILRACQMPVDGMNVDVSANAIQYMTIRYK